VGESVIEAEDWLDGREHGVVKTIKELIADAEARGDG
jgi:hypothetical protein